MGTKISSRCCVFSARRHKYVLMKGCANDATTEWIANFMFANRSRRRLACFCWG